MKHFAPILPIALLCAASFVVAACAPLRAPMPGPDGFAAAWDADRWRGSLVQRFDRWQRFQAVYQAKWTDSLERVWRAKVLVTAQLPDKMRIEILNSWGQIQGLFVLREPSAYLWLVGEKSLYRSRHSAGLLDKLVGIGLPGTALAPTLVGLPPKEILDGAPARRLQDGAVVFGEANLSEGFARRYGLCPDMERICRMEFDLSGTTLSILFQYDTQGDFREIPSALSFRSETGSVDLSRTLVMRPADIPSETFEPPSFGDAVRIVEIP
uniref:DUF4292 domain-containing protein n=1 Tax=Desulfacinum infernum TaxID=35837 RepID=A0A832A3M3_9BACT